KVELEQFAARGPSEFESAFSRMAKSRIDAVVVPSNVLFNYNVAALADLAAKKRLPSAGVKAFAEAGGLIGYGLNFPEMDGRAAYFVDRILNGVKPADLPVQQPTKFDLVINLKTAKTLGLTIPQSLPTRSSSSACPRMLVPAGALVRVAMLGRPLNRMDQHRQARRDESKPAERHNGAAAAMRATTE